MSHSVIKLNSIPSDKIDEAKRLGKVEGVHLVIETSRLNRLLKKPTPSKPAEWPWRIKLLALSSIESDKGVGDTAERVFGVFGGNSFKKYVAILGLKCGCGERKDDWNRRYPFLPSNDQGAKGK